MLLLGHTGLTLGAAVIIGGAWPAGRRQPGAAVRRGWGQVEGWFLRLARRADIRLLLIGSLLPDIIDKPVGQVWLRDSIGSGRIYAHSLLFLLGLAVVGLAWYRLRAGNGPLLLAAGVLAHLVFDQMWLEPVSLLWPLQGLAFPRTYYDGWAGSLWQDLLHKPSTYIPEIAGGVVLCLFAAVLWRQRAFRAFLLRGRLEGQG